MDCETLFEIGGNLGGLGPLRGLESGQWRAVGTFAAPGARRFGLIALRRLTAPRPSPGREEGDQANLPDTYLCSTLAIKVW